jgi:hypothetical protein
MWVPSCSLQHLDSTLIGYAVAAEIHGSEDGAEFGNNGTFPAWLWKRLGMAYPSALRWAVEIERAAEAADMPPMELFFSLLDEYRANQAGPPISEGEQEHRCPAPQGGHGAPGGC